MYPVSTCAQYYTIHVRYKFHINTSSHAMHMFPHMHSDADTLVYDTIRAGAESSHGHGKFVNAKASKKGGPIFLMVVVVVVVVAVVVVYGLEEWRHLFREILLFSEVVSKAH